MPQTLSMAISEGPVQPNISPDVVTIEFVVLVLSSMVRGATRISLRAGREKARVVPSPKTPTRAWPRSSKSTTFAASQRKSSNVL